MPTPAIQANIQGAPIRVEMKAPQGPGGKSAYQIAVENGFVGTEAQWLASLVGPNTVTSATTTNFTSGNVLFANSGFVGSLSRSGIDTRTSFPNNDVTNATTTGTPSQLLRLNSAGNTVANIFIALEGIEIGEEGGDAGFIRILNNNGDVVTINNANSSNAEISLPTESGTLALTTDIVDSVTSATTSNGTANLSISNVTTATATVSSLLTANHIHGNIAGTLYTHVRTGEAMSKGDPFYISGFHVGSSQPIVMKADASNAAKMPAVGVMDADYANNTSGANGIISGTLSSINTHGYAVNSPIYVKDGGGYSSVAGTIRQQVGITERANTNTGAFIVTNSKVISSADITDFTTAVEAIAPNAVTSATTSDGTASLNISNLTLSQAITSGLQTKMVFTAEPTAVGDGQQIIWQWYNGGSPITTAAISSEATGSTTDKLIFQTTAGGSLGTSLDLTNTLATFSGSISSLGESYRATSTFTYASGAAAAHRTALGLTTLATTTPGTNVATFLETPTSANLASALTDENGTGGGFVRAEGATLTSPALVGPVNLTSQDASTSDRVMTRDLSESNHMRNVGIVREIHPACMSFTSASGGSAIVNVDGGFSLANPVTANAYSRAALVRSWANYPASTGTNNPCNVPVAFAMCGLVVPPSDVNAVVRFVIGEVGSGTPALPSANALSARGFGFEIYWNTTNSRAEIRMFSHDGTSYTTSSMSIAYNASLGRHFSAMVTSDGSGVSKLFYDTSAAGTAPPRVPLTAAITHTAPSSLNYGQPFASAYCVNASTATTVNTGVRFFSSRLQVGTIY